MKKNLIGAIVVFFVTLAFLLVIDDISRSKNSPSQDNAEIYEANDRKSMVTSDQE